MLGGDGTSNGSGKMEREKGRGDCGREGGHHPDDAEAGGWGGGFFPGAESVYCSSSNRYSLLITNVIVIDLFSLD